MALSVAAPRIGRQDRPAATPPPSVFRWYTFVYRPGSTSLPPLCLRKLPCSMAPNCPAFTARGCIYLLSRRVAPSLPEESVSTISARRVSTAPSWRLPELPSAELVSTPSSSSSLTPSDLGDDSAPGGLPCLGSLSSGLTSTGAQKEALRPFEGRVSFPCTFDRNRASTVQQEYDH